MTAHSRRFVAALILLTAGACGRRTTVADDSLRRDLDLARGQGLELAPHAAAAQTVVSAEELAPTGTHAKATATHTPSAKRTPPPASPSAPPAVAQTAPAPAQQRDSIVAAAPATNRPDPKTAISPAPKGGYKTMGELIRKAPFPINP
jgi:hypothetical protein